MEKQCELDNVEEELRSSQRETSMREVRAECNRECMAAEGR